MNNIPTETFNESQYAHLKQTLPPQSYDEFISFQKNHTEFEAYKVKQRIEGRKKDAGTDYFSRRQTLVMRHADVEALAPDEDVLAYVDIHKMLKAKMMAEGTYEEKKTKIIVSDEAIKAFRDLEDEDLYFKDITLVMVNTRVEANKALAEAEKT